MKWSNSDRVTNKKARTEVLYQSLEMSRKRAEKVVDLSCICHREDKGRFKKLQISYYKKSRQLAQQGKHSICKEKPLKILK